MQLIKAKNYGNKHNSLSHHASHLPARLTCMSGGVFNGYLGREVRLGGSNPDPV